MSDWLLLKCPTCGNLFRVPMDSGQDSAECSMCRESVYFEPSEDNEGVRAIEPSPRNDGQETDADAEPSPRETQPVGREVAEKSSSEPSREPEAHPDAGESEIKPPTAKGETHSGSIDTTASAKTPAAPAIDEEKIRKTDEAYTDKPSMRKHGSRSRKRRRIKKPGAKPEEFGWDSDRRGGRRRSDWQTGFFITGGALVMILLMAYLVSKSQEVEAESYESKMERERNEALLAQQKSSMADYLEEAEIKSRPQWQVDFQNSPDRFIRKLKPILLGFLDAETWQERLKYSADAEAVRPLMKDYYEENDDGPYDYQEAFVGNTVSVGEFFITSSILMGDYSNRSFVMLRDEDGNWSVDWESFVGYSTMGMSEFQEKRPTEPQLFRLTITRPRPGYFNYYFSDEQAWDCYVLYGGDAGEVLYAYVKKFSKESSELKDVLALNEAAAITLMIRYPEDAPSDNQVEIVEVIGKGWVPSIQRETRDKKNEEADDEAS